jgi:hypothetical protein
METNYKKNKSNFKNENEAAGLLMTPTGRHKLQSSLALLAQNAGLEEHAKTRI